MKRKATILIIFALITGSAAAIVDHNDTDEGDMSITSAGSTDTSQETTVNETGYHVSVDMGNISTNQTSDSVHNITHSDSKIEFEGTVRVPTPCHALEHDVEQTEEGYILDLQAIENISEGEMCTQVIAGINYDAEFEADSGFELEVQHNGELVEVINQNSEDQAETNTEGDEKSFIERLLAFLGL